MREETPKTTIATKVKTFNIRSEHKLFFICSQKTNFTPNQTKIPIINTNR